jgi:hypothetical protein
MATTTSANAVYIFIKDRKEGVKTSVSSAMDMLGARIRTNWVWRYKVTEINVAQHWSNYSQDLVRKDRRGKAAAKKNENSLASKGASSSRSSTAKSGNKTTGSKSNSNVGSSSSSSSSSTTSTGINANDKLFERHLVEAIVCDLSNDNDISNATLLSDMKAKFEGSDYVNVLNPKKLSNKLNNLFGTTSVKNAKGRLNQITPLEAINDEEKADWIINNKGACLSQCKEMGK